MKIIRTSIISASKNRHEFWEICVYSIFIVFKTTDKLKDNCMDYKKQSLPRWCALSKYIDKKLKKERLLDGSKNDKPLEPKFCISMLYSHLAPKWATKCTYLTLPESVFFSNLRAGGLAGTRGHNIPFFALQLRFFTRRWNSILFFNLARKNSKNWDIYCL